MSMKLSEFNKLKKLMMMTTSDNDQETLTAIRAANRILKEHNYDWNATFGKLVKVEDTYPDVIEETDPDEERERQEIREALDEVEASEPRASFNDFIASLREQFERKGYLTFNQKQALFKSRDRLRSRR